MTHASLNPLHVSHVRIFTDDTYRLSRRAAYLTAGALSLSVWAGLGLLVYGLVR